MSKIEIKAILKTTKDIHEFTGKGLKNKNTITYNDDGILTKITLHNPITLERKDNYYIKLQFKKDKIQKGIYQTNEGNFIIDIETKELIIEENSIKIKYNLKINNVYVDTFTYKLQYTIDR